MMRGLVVVIAGLSLVVGTAASGAELHYLVAPAADVGGARYAKNKILLQLTPRGHSTVNRALFPQGKIGIPEIDQLGEREGAVHIRATLPGVVAAVGRARPAAMERWHTVTFRREIDIPAVVEEYRATPGVATAQPVHLYPILREPNDSLFVDGSQWHLQTGKVDGPGAWEVERGSDQVVVAVIDTGVRYYHKDLGGPDASYLDPGPGGVGGNIWTNPAEVAGSSGVDDDGNGYVDDWVGYDFVDGASPCDDPLPWPYNLYYAPEDCDVPDSDPRDYQGHGTHCAGSVAAINNNVDYDYPLSVASVAGGWWDQPTGTFEPGARVMVLRAGWSASAGLAGYVSEDHAAEAFIYAADNGARIASCSWGGVSENDELLRQAVQYFLDKGGLVFKAAGNGASSVPDNMSSRWSNLGGVGVHSANLLNVAATDQSDCKAGFSDYGDWVDIAAPGVTIWSTHHAFFEPESDKVYAMDGTSMAAPIAAGVAALIWSHTPGLTADQVRGQLLGNAAPLPEACGYAGQLGAGRVDAARALKAAAASNQQPVANAGEDQTVSDADENGVETVNLNGTASYDPDGTVVAYEWKEDSTPLGGTASITAEFGVGVHTVTLMVTDDDGAVDSDEVLITVNPNTPPVVSIEMPADGATFDSGNHMTFVGSASDPEDGNLTPYLLWSSDLDGVIGTGGTVTTKGKTRLSNGTHEITASVSDSGKAAGSAAIIIRVGAGSSTSPGATMHIGNLGGSAKSLKSFWNATVAILVHDESHNPVAGATVSGNDGTASCTTESDGQCSITFRKIPNFTSDITFRVDNVTHAALTYGGTNHDPDGDSDGTSITLSKP